VAGCQNRLTPTRWLPKKKKKNTKYNKKQNQHIRTISQSDAQLLITTTTTMQQ